MNQTASSTLLDSYSESYKTTASALYKSPTSQRWACGQTFTMQSTYSISSAKFYMAKNNSPVGTLYAKIYATTGTVGTDALPVGDALATSEGIDVTTLPVTPNFELITFTFSGDEQVLLFASNNYAIVCFFDASLATNYDLALVGEDNTTKTHAGNGCSLYNGSTPPPTWGQSNVDYCFYLYGTRTINVKTVNGLARANTKSKNGLSNV